ncbi:MAG: hydrogenase maturation nickel metallochaperone HypA [Flavobacteriaceae bacterium]|nr:hydrogenase maturation nickel metallochaperone HypA [Flavobacteriaceae bacterium]
MHELSIALGIVKIAEQEIAKSGNKHIEAIELEIGTLAGIEFEALDFVWPMAVKDTVLENAEKKIQIIQAQGKCIDCDNIYHLENIYDPCPKCGSFFKSILQGKELRVKSLEIS